MLNIGFIGCGGIARHHASRLAQLGNCRIIAAADAVGKAAQSFATDFQGDREAAVFTDYRELLRLDAVDAVWVCTPTYLHAAPAIAAARAGKHVFCEKPMAMKLGDARRMAEAAERAGVCLTIGLVRRFCPQWGKMKTIVRKGTLGRPVIWRFAAGGRPGQPWFRDAGKGGGPLLDGAIHNYDFALQMLGAVETVQASSAQFDSTSVGADTASAILTFASGDQHTLIWTWGMAPGAFHVLLFDGVYVAAAEGAAPDFIPAPPLEDGDVQEIVETAAERIVRLLQRRGLLDDSQEDELTEAEPLQA